MSAVQKVFIVEDDDITLQALCQRIDAHPDFAVLFAGSTCREIRRALQAEQPDILLVDIGLPDGNGIDIIAEAAARYPQTAILVVTVFGDEGRVIAAIKAGATGYLLKDDESHEIGAALRQLRDGGSPISPAIARHLVRLFKLRSCPPVAAATGILTGREQEILVLSSKGFSYGEIAEMLTLAIGTVATHTKQIYKKLAVNSRTEALYEAARMGLLDHS